MVQGIADSGRRRGGYSGQGAVDSGPCETASGRKKFTVYSFQFYDLRSKFILHTSSFILSLGPRPSPLTN